MRGKPREKEWCETSLDSNPSPVGAVYPFPAQRVMVQRSQSQQSPTAPMLMPRDVQKEPPPLQSLESWRRGQPDNSVQQPMQYASQTRPKVLEIPAESKPQDSSDDSIVLNSPNGQTVVHSGKYQPYREVTKPFEMSDFYKYSTKYRKRAEQLRATTTHNNNATVTQDENKYPPQASNINAHDVKQDAANNYVNSIDKAASGKVQKGICQPAQRMA